MFMLAIFRLKQKKYDFLFNARSQSKNRFFSKSNNCRGVSSDTWLILRGLCSLPGNGRKTLALRQRLQLDFLINSSRVQMSLNSRPYHWTPCPLVEDPVDFYGEPLNHSDLSGWQWTWGHYREFGKSEGQFSQMQLAMRGTYLQSRQNGQFRTAS